MCVCVCAVRVEGEGGKETRIGRQINKRPKKREQPRPRNLDGTVRDLLPTSPFLCRDWVSFLSAPLTLQSSNSPLCPPPPARPPPPPACACLCVCLSLTGEPNDADSGEAQSQGTDLPTNSPTRTPQAGRHSPSQS